MGWYFETKKKSTREIEAYYTKVSVWAAVKILEIVLGFNRIGRCTARKKITMSFLSCFMSYRGCSSWNGSKQLQCIR